MHAENRAACDGDRLQIADEIETREKWIRCNGDCHIGVRRSQGYSDARRINWETVCVRKVVGLRLDRVYLRGGKWRRERARIPRPLSKGGAQRVQSLVGPAEADDRPDNHEEDGDNERKLDDRRGSNGTSYNE